MTPKEIAKDACDYLFRVGKYQGAKIDFDPRGYLADRITEAVRTERNECVKIAAMYGGHDAEKIAEEIGQRNFKG